MRNDMPAGQVKKGKKLSQQELDKLIATSFADPDRKK